jgi:predicted nucleotidyltransferase component of viral defense system
MASIEDIAAMKVYAIIARGAKRDFFDLHTLMERFSLSEMIELAKIKYPESTQLHTIRSLTFFDDAEEDEDPKMFSPVSWEAVKDRIRTEVKRIVL